MVSNKNCKSNHDIDEMMYVSLHLELEFFLGDMRIQRDFRIMDAKIKIYIYDLHHYRS